MSSIREGGTLRFGVVTTTVNENERALLWRGSLWKRRSEPGRNQEESGEKLLRKLMRSQVFSEVFRASARKTALSTALSPGFLWGFAGVLPGFHPGNPAFRGAFLTPRGGFPRAFKTAVIRMCGMRGTRTRRPVRGTLLWMPCMPCLPCP